MTKSKHIERVPIQILTCKGKIPYDSIVTALAAKEALEERVWKTEPGKQFNIYCCHHCGQYHIGGVACQN